MGNILTNSNSTNQINSLTDQVKELTTTNTNLINLLYTLTASQYIKMETTNSIKTLSTNYYYTSCKLSDVNNIFFGSTKLNNNNFYGYYYNENIYLSIPLSPYVTDELKIGKTSYTFTNDIAPKIDINSINYSTSKKLTFKGTNFLNGNTITISINELTLKIKDSVVISNNTNIKTNDLSVKYSQTEITITNIDFSEYTSYFISIANLNGCTSNTVPDKITKNIMDMSG